SAALFFVSALAPLLSFVSAQQTCNITNPCGEEHACCSDFGFCSNDFCRGGCNPLRSFSPQSCTPLPLCKDATYTFPDISRIVNSTVFDGNATAYDWTIDNTNMDMSEYLSATNGELALFLSEKNGGTRISSTRYVHYGRVTATMKITGWAGVVSTFIGMSDAKDEIDWEFPGTSGASEAQSNYFWLGVVDNSKPNGGKFDMSAGQYHDFTYDWSPDRLNYEIDGKVVHTLERSKLVDKDGITKYPSTPMRIQFSIWPAGISTATQGVIEWAGGMIDWNNADYKAAGHFYVQIKKVQVQCNVAGELAPPADALSYVYGQNVSGNPSVSFSNQSSMTSAAPSAYVLGFRNLAPLAAAGLFALAALAM
ncbi:concanavalin A-like lectin/glucanase domain-containing protein, partial [Auriculariales sp. MPI-PUGE-AT-0066]